MVTQNYLDSQDDDSESDGSEDDWKPAVDRQKLSRKRPNNIPAGKQRKLKKKAVPNAKSKYTVDNSSESESGEEVFYSQSSHSSTFDVEAGGGGASSYKTKSSEKNYPDRNGIFQLYVYKPDLLTNYATDEKLCLWRWDGDLLLQKYIRIKDSHHQFCFTSSSVYSNWNEQRKHDFEIIDVKCLEENDRRVTLLNITKFHELAEKNAAEFAEPDEFDGDDGDDDEEDNYE